MQQNCLLVAAIASISGHVYNVPTSTCPGSGICGCGWATRFRCQRHDDGTECNCRCCCKFRGGCVWGSAVLPAEVGSSRASKFYMYDLPASMNVGIRPSLGRGINRWFHNEAPEVQTELRLHAILANSSSRTRNPAEAGLFVVPAFPVSFCSATRKRCFTTGTFAGGSSCHQPS